MYLYCRIHVYNCWIPIRIERTQSEKIKSYIAIGHVGCTECVLFHFERIVFENAPKQWLRSTNHFLLRGAIFLTKSYVSIISIDLLDDMPGHIATFDLFATVDHSNTIKFAPFGFIDWFVRWILIYLQATGANENANPCNQRN